MSKKIELYAGDTVWVIERDEELVPGGVNWLVYDSWAPGGHWKTCDDCKRSKCFRAGHYFIACEHHTKNKPDTGGP